MGNLSTFNLDLIVTGLVTAGMAVLGFTVLMSDLRSVTAKSFFLFTMAGMIWSILNYTFYHVADPNIAFPIMRTVICIAVWLVLFLFRFLYAFPKTDFTFPNWYRFLVVPGAALVSIVTLTPLVFVRVSTLAPDGTITGIENGPGIFLFVATVTALIFGGLLLFIHKMQREPKESQSQYKSVLWGLFITFVLIITFNLLLPAFFNDSRFILYSALFILPTVVGAAYAIRVRHLFNIKVFSTALLVFLLSAASFGEIIVSNTVPLVLLRITIFIFVLVFGINLIRSVIREVGLREKIQKLAEDLESSNEQLSEFMSLATHEIRNPATFIKGFTAGALEGDLGELAPAVKDGMQKIFVRANDIIHLGNQYLDKSKLELNQIKYEYVPTDLGKLAGDLVYEFESAAAQQKITITADIDKNQSYEVQADRGKIKEVIGNLIDNSIKYTKQGSVTVSVAKGDGTVTIKIVDTGNGIPAEVIPQLFKKFSRADAQKANLLGTGLGLYLAKIFIDAHHGKIWVESPGKDQGSTFYVELPISQKESPIA